MSVPIVLPSGMALIYGMGVQNSQTGIIPDNTAFRFGTIYQVWSGGGSFIYGSGAAMFKESDVVCRLTWDNYPYTLIEFAKLAIQEDTSNPL